MEASGWSRILSCPLESPLERASFPSSPSRSPDVEIHRRLVRRFPKPVAVARLGVHSLGWEVKHMD